MSRREPGSPPAGFAPAPAPGGGLTDAAILDLQARVSELESQVAALIPPPVPLPLPPVVPVPTEPTPEPVPTPKPMPEHPPVVPEPPAPPIIGRKLGVNLNPSALAYSSSPWQFADILTQSSLPNPLPATGTYHGQVLLDSAWPGGPLTFHAIGAGTLKIDTHTITFDGSPNQPPRTIDLHPFAPNPGGWGTVELLWVTPDETNPFTSLKAYREVNDDAGDLWHTGYLNDLAPFGVLRFKDWLSVDRGIDPGLWNDRPLYGGPMHVHPYYPPLLISTLIRALDRPTIPWISIPHLASDEWIGNLANLIDATVPYDVPILLEWSNEPWNWNVPQTAYNAAQPTVWPDGVPTRDMAESYAARALHAFTVAQDAAPSRKLIRVANCQSGWWDWSRRFVETSEDNGHGRAFDAVAIAPYLILPEVNPPDLAALPQRPEADAFATLADAYMRAIEDQRKYIRQWTAWGRARGYPIHAYECGFHVVSQGQIRDPAVRALATRFERSPLIGPITEAYLAMLREELGPDAMIVWFWDCGIDSEYGTWGAQTHTGAGGPRWEALIGGAARTTIDQATKGPS